MHDKISRRQFRGGQEQTCCDQDLNGRNGPNVNVDVDESAIYSGNVASTETHQAIETVFRVEQASLVAGLARMVRDVGLAEELA